MSTEDTQKDSYIQQQKHLYSNAYGRWSEDEDKELVELYNTGVDINELMLFFKRNEDAIKSRIKKLLGKSR